MRTFAPHWFTKPFGVVIKREFGVNPKQSRCCKLYFKVFELLTPLFVSTKEAEREGLENRSESEDLPCVRTEE